MVVRGSEPGLVCLLVLVLYLRPIEISLVGSLRLCSNDWSLLDSLLVLLFSSLANSGATEKMLR